MWEALQYLGQHWLRLRHRLTSLLRPITTWWAGWFMLRPRLNASDAKSFTRGTISSRHRAPTGVTKNGHQLSCWMNVPYTKKIAIPRAHRLGKAMGGKIRMMIGKLRSTMPSRAYSPMRTFETNPTGNRRKKAAWVGRMEERQIRGTLRTVWWRRTPGD